MNGMNAIGHSPGLVDYRIMSLTFQSAVGKIGCTDVAKKGTIQINVK